MGNEVDQIIRRAARPRPAPAPPKPQRTAPAPTRRAEVTSPAELEFENSDLRRQLQQREMRQAFELAGRKRGAYRPEDVWKLVDLGAVAFDDAGAVTNAAELVAGLDAGHFAPPDGHSHRGSADGGAAGRRSMPVEVGSNVDQYLRRNAGR